MASFLYTARRGLIAGHIADQQYAFDIDLSAWKPSRNVERTDVRAKGGATESLYHRADDEYGITFAPASGALLDELLEFLKSTESGEVFQMQVYGTESRFIEVTRVDTGHELIPFIEVGSERGDYFQTSITVRAA